MTGRLLILHLRARRVPSVVLGLGVVAVVCWRLADAVAHGSDVPDPAARATVVALASLAAAVVISTALSGADDELERSTRTRWAGLRASLLVALTTLAAVLLASTALWEPARFGAHAAVRGVVGGAGLVALSAAVVGVRAAWGPVMAITVAALSWRAADPSALAVALTWQYQPTGEVWSWVAAIGLGLAGVAVHAWRGARVRAI